MRIMTASQVRAALPMRACVAAARLALQTEAEVPERPSLRTPSGHVLFMPGRLAGIGLGVKVVGVFPGNPDRDLPGTLGAVLLIAEDTGEPEALLDGTALTSLRTGAETGVATERLARPDAAVLAVLGAGGIARDQIQGVRAVRPIREVRLWNRTAARAEALAATLTGLTVRVLPTAHAAVGGADVVVCCTGATTPVLQGAWLGPGTHINAVGGFRPDMMEVDAACVARSSVVATDNPIEAAVCGDLAGRLPSGRLARIATATRPPHADLTLFKGVGTAALDLAAARAALAAGTGLEVDLGR